MSLPFFDKKKTVSVILEKRGKLPVELNDESEAGQGISPELKEACEGILRAIEHKSVIDLAHAITEAMNVIADAPMTESENKAHE